MGARSGVGVSWTIQAVDLVPVQLAFGGVLTDRLAGLAAYGNLAFEDDGDHELKGLPERWHLYRVVR